MANIIKIKRSNTSGVIPATLQDGELAINQADKLLFYKDNLGVIRSLSLVDSSGGSVNYKEVILDFGTIINKTNNKTFFIAEALITSTSKVLVSVSGNATTDHSSDEIMLMYVSVFATNIQEGIGFDIKAVSPQKVYGKFKVNYLITN